MDGSRTVSLTISFNAKNSTIFLVNGCEINKSFVADNAECSISDVSSWFQTKLPNSFRSKDLKKNLADETFETKVANFRNLLIKVKEIIDGEREKQQFEVQIIDGFRFPPDSYSDNAELAKTTANLERVVAKIIDDEEKRRSSSIKFT